MVHLILFLGLTLSAPSKTSCDAAAIDALLAEPDHDSSRLRETADTIAVACAARIPPALGRLLTMIGDGVPMNLGEVAPDLRQLLDGEPALWQPACGKSGSEVAKSFAAFEKEREPDPHGICKAPAALGVTSNDRAIAVVIGAFTFAWLRADGLDERRATALARALIR